ncbi:MAG: hypothetical protein WD873_02725, partial [Candidatus Hydrogenedentales bacterium]
MSTPARGVFVYTFPVKDFGITQTQWRRLGAATLLVAAAMAVYAVWSGFLGVTVLHLAALASDEAA